VPAHPVAPVWTRTPLLHSRPQLSTRKQSKITCQVETAGLRSRQIESGSVKNFSAQLKEGATA
jgi:hypothetical protein